MHIAFLLSKTSELKCLAPIILAGLDSNLKISLLCGPDPENSHPNLPREKPIKENILLPHKEKINFLYFQNDQDLYKIIKENNISDVITLSFRPDSFPALTNIKNISRVHTIQSFMEFLYITPTALNNLTSLFIHGEKMKDIYQSFYPDCPKDLIDKKMLVSGNPNLDTLYNLPPKEYLLKKYGLPKNKNIILFLSPTASISKQISIIFNNPNRINAIYKSIRKLNLSYLIAAIFKINYLDLIKKIKLWAIKNNSVLVVKSKIKFKNPDFLVKSADFTIDDSPQWFPYQTIELISLADLVIIINGSAALESIPCKTYSITIRVDPENKATEAAKHAFQVDFYKNKNLCTILDYTQVDNFLKKNNLKDLKVSEADQVNFIKNYSASIPQKSAPIIIKHLLKQKDIKK